MDISQAAFDLIVAEEVTSQELYEQKYRQPTWPRGQSGVTIGIGYDVGYSTPLRLRADWGRRISDDMIVALESACGVTGTAAQSLASQLSNVNVPWNAAIGVFRDVDVPRWTATVRKELPNTNRLSPDCLGALVSLAYNRGASFSKAGNRYEEMRNIKQRMLDGDLAYIPDEIRAMKRLWPTIKGLRNRRDHEAALFQRGLMQPATPAKPPVSSERLSIFGIIAAAIIAALAFVFRRNKGK